jgi:integrase
MKTGQARVVDIDADTVAPLRGYRATRCSLSPELARDAALVLDTLGQTLPPERCSRRLVGQVEDQLPKILLPDLCHTHARLLLAAREPVKVVTEQLGHASATITLTVYQHVHPAWAVRPPTSSPLCSRAD